MISPSGATNTSDLDFRIVARESISVPAGTFNAFRIEGHGFGLAAAGAYSEKHTLWYDPERVRLLSIAREITLRHSRGILRADRTELASFKQA